MPQALIELRRIGPENHESARRLSVRHDQNRFVATVDKSLADAYVWSDAEFRIAYADALPVGYVMIYPFERDGRRVINIVRLMIDAEFQGQGLGRALLQKTLDWIRSMTPTPALVRISTVPDNAVALRLYQAAGFQAQGEEEGEIALYLPV
jgi:diamine N-acetyltransferase